MLGFFSTRRIRVALLLCVSLGIHATAYAQAQTPQFRTRTEIHQNVGQFTQIANMATFSTFQGGLENSADLTLPGVAPGSMRSIRVLVPTGDGERVNLSVSAGPGKYALLATIVDNSLFLYYVRPRTLTIANPFGNLPEGRHEPVADEWAWGYSIPLTRRVSQHASHLLTTLYVFPKGATDMERQAHGNMVVVVNEAIVKGTSVVVGESLTVPLGLNVDNDALNEWRHAVILTSPGRVVTSNHPQQLLPTFVEQRAVSFNTDSDGTRRRDKRCIENMMNTIYSHSLSTWLWELVFGAPHNICNDGPRTNAIETRQIDVTPLPELPPPNIDLTVYEAQEIDPGNAPGFNVAMGIAFCNDAGEPSTSSEACMPNDRQAIAAIGDLPAPDIRALLRRINEFGAGAAATAQTLRTGNARLDAWLNEDWERAANALNAAAGIARVSEMPGQPERAPVNQNRSKKNVIQASCVAQGSRAQDGSDEGSSEAPWQCVNNAKKQLKQSGQRIALQPNVQARREYHLRGTPEFNRLTRAFINAERGLPHDMRAADFPLLTHAIAHDGARTGDNLGLVYLNDATWPANREARFRFGLEHILAPGRGGGDNAGHREDWRELTGLPVNREILVPLIMQALIDTDAQYTVMRGRTGNTARTYRRFLFRNGGALYQITNIRIVLGQNGMVITAYPLQGARAEPLNM